MGSEQLLWQSSHSARIARRLVSLANSIHQWLRCPPSYLSGSNPELKGEALEHMNNNIYIQMMFDWFCVDNMLTLASPMSERFLVQLLLLHLRLYNHESFFFHSHLNSYYKHSIKICVISNTFIPLALPLWRESSFFSFLSSTHLTANLGILDWKDPNKRGKLWQGGRHPQVWNKQKENLNILHQLTKDLNMSCHRN